MQDAASKCGRQISLQSESAATQLVQKSAPNERLETYEPRQLKDSTFQQGVVNQREPNLAKTHCQKV